MSMDRIIEMTEVEQPSDNDYVHLQSPTLGDRRIKANNLGNGDGGESIDGLYFDGTNSIYLWLPYYCEDYELEIAFYLPSYQHNKSIIGNTANGYYFDLTMYNNNWTINGGNTNQIIYTPQSFKGDHIVILNRLADRAVIFDNENIGTMGTNNFSNSIPLLIGYRPQTGSPEFVLKHLKITSHATSEVLANYEAGFRYLKYGYKIPCLLNTVDGTYIDLDTGGRPAGQTGDNDGHIMLCQKGNLDPNYNYYSYNDDEIVVRVYHEGKADEEIRWYFHNFSMPTGRQTFPTELARFYTTGANNQSAKSYTINTQNVNGWTVLGDYLGGTINEYNTGYNRLESHAFDAMVIIGDGTEQDTVYTDPYVYL